MTDERPFPGEPEEETRPLARQSGPTREIPAIEDPDVEPIESIVFNQPPLRVTADEPVAPRTEPQTLTRRRIATLEAFAQALIPPGGVIPQSASDVGVGERIDAAASGFDASVRRRLDRALLWWEWLSVFTRALRPFSRLPAPVAVGVVARAQRSWFIPRRNSFTFLKTLCLNEWASTASVEQAIGFTYGCVTSEPPQRGPALEVIGFRDITRDHVEECDAVVVGSGAGGAVMAKELAESGLSVIVVEEGSYFTRDDFAGPPWTRYRKLYREQGLTAVRGNPPMPMPLGRAVGGTTLVSAGTCARTPDEVLTRWGSDAGIEGIDPESMTPWFQRVEKIIHARPAPEELLGRNAHLFRRGAQSASIDARPVVRAIEGCRGCGVCTLGCPSDAKQSTHLNYLPRAQHQGAGIVANCRVVRIIVDGGRARGVEGRLVDPATGAPGPRLLVRSKVVVLAAGAIHTPTIMQRNALGGRSGRLGNGLRVSPTASVWARFDEDVFSWRGTQQSFVAQEWQASHDLLVHATALVPGIVAGSVDGTGASVKDVIAHLKNYANADVSLADSSSGSVRAVGSGEPVVSYSLNKIDARKLGSGIAHTAELFLQAGAKTVFAPLAGVPEVSSASDLDRMKEAALRPRGLRVRAAYPVGTASMGADPAASVVGPFGECHDVRGLFVADASVMPGSPAVPPMVTIMALATRTADYMVRERSLYFG